MSAVVFCSCACRLWWFVWLICIFMMCRSVGGIEILMVSFFGDEFEVVDECFY